MTDWDIIQPPSTMVVPEPDKRPVLYQADGTPLVRRGIGFARDCPTSNQREMERKP